MPENNISPDSNINPNELFNKPEENPPTIEPPMPSTEEPVTLVPEQSDDPSTNPVQEPVPPIPSVQPSEVIPPVQTDLNQVPPGEPSAAIQPEPVPSINPTPQTAPFPSQDVTNTGFTEKVDKGKNIKKPLIIIIVLIAIALLGYFVIYPMIAKNFMASPKNVFQATVDKISTNLNKKIDQVNLGSSLYDIDFTFDTNIEEMKSFANYKYKLKGGIDSKNKLIEGKASMTGSDNKELGAILYVKNDYLFYKLSSDERIVKSMDLSQDESYKMLFSDKETINSDDLQYLIDKVKGLLFGELKEEDFTKEDNYTLNVNGSEIKTTKNVLTIDKNKYIALNKAIINGLYEDNKAMEIITKTGLTKEEFKKAAEDANYDSIEEDYKIIINIYSIKTDVVGFDLYNKEEKELYFYSNDGNFESAMLPGDENNEITFVGVKDGDATNATFKVAGKEMAKFKIYAFDDNEVKFDYTINAEEDSKMSGSIDIKANNNVTDIAFSANAGKEYVKGNAKIKIEENAKIANFDDSKAVTVNEEEQNKMLEAFMESAKGSPLEFFSENLGGMTYNNSEYYKDYNSSTSNTEATNSF